jgi:methionyl-tRNA synthetase
MGQNHPYKLVDELPANEFFKLEGRQFSKSDGWYIDLDDFFKRYTTDQIRYTIAANAPETSDSEFTWKDFQLRCNSDLLGKYGNLVNRVLVFAKNHCHSSVPSLEDLEPVDQEFIKNVYQIVDQTKESYQTFKLRRASQLIMELAQIGNVYFDHKHPWKDAKDPQTRARMERTLACCFECLKALALISSPIIPETANQLWKLLGYTPELNVQDWHQVVNTPISFGQKLQEPQILFHKIEDIQIAQEIEKLEQLSKINQQQKAPQYVPLKEEIDIEQFSKLDLRVALVLSAKPLPKSKKLLELSVDLGFEKRTIVAGISQYYTPETIVGKKIVVVANLKPATLMGVQSQGMVLAAKMDSVLKTISVEDLPPGSVVSSLFQKQVHNLFFRLVIVSN